MAPVNDSANNKGWFFFTLLFLFIDYGRPQDIIGLGFIRPGMICTIILFIFLISTGHLNTFGDKQIKMIYYFVILLAVYIPFAKNNHFAYLTTLNMALFIPFILSTLICVDSINRLKIMISTMIGLMVYIALYSILHHGHGPGSYFTDENDLALYLNTYIPFCYFLLLCEANKIKKIIYTVCFIIGIIAIFNSSSRGGFIGLISMISTIWLLSSKKIISLIFIYLLLIGAFTLGNMSGSYFDEMATITDIQSGTANERRLTWNSAWRMFLDNPWGVGGGNFMIRFPEYQAEDFQRGMWGRVAHSLWFTLLPELGIVGVIIYFRLLYFNFRDIIFLKRIVANNNELEYLHSLSMAFIASLAGFFASATFLSVLYYAHYYYLTALIVVATVVGKDIINKRKMGLVNIV